MTENDATPSPVVPTIDLGPWRSGDPEVRAATASAVDAALRAAGFLLVTGHGVDPELRAGIRSAAREFFLLPASAKAPYAVRVGGRGWLGPGAEANAGAEGMSTPPDLKESLSFAAHAPTGDPVVDTEWFLPNSWPAEVPGLRPLTEIYLARMRALSDEVLGTARGRTSARPPRLLHPAYRTPHVGLQRQLVPGDGRGGKRCGPVSSGSDRTPTSARSPTSLTGRRAGAVCRSSRMTRAGGTRPTIRPRSPSTSVI